MFIVFTLIINFALTASFCFLYSRRKQEQWSLVKNFKECIKSLENEKNELKNINDNLLIEIEQNEKALDEVINKLYNQSSKFEEEIKKYKNNLDETKKLLYDNYSKEVNKHLKELDECIDVLVNEYIVQMNCAEATLKQQKASISAYIEEQKRKEEMSKKQDYYRMVLSDNEIKDIDKLLSLSSELSQPDILLKLIYKTYFEKKMNDLLTRVVGVNSERSGIYKITNIELDKAYIGQCVSFKDRWRTHLKKGLGIDTPSTNKFYQAMKEYKPWNFTFEVLEFCSKDELNKKESYWIDFYQTNTWGYNGNKGVEK